MKKSASKKENFGWQKNAALTFLFIGVLGIALFFNQVSAQDGNNSALSVQRLFADQFDNKYSLTLEDPEGIAEFLINKANGDPVWGGNPSCLVSITSDTVTLSPEDFPLSGYVIDCEDENENVQNSVQASMPPLPVISGYKFYDADGSGGARDINDPGIAGWRITLIGKDETETTYEDVDGSFGSYKFSELSDGAYAVCERAYDNWTQVYPTGVIAGAVECDENEGYAPWGWEITIENGEIAGDPGSFDFGNTPKLGAISVVKFNDRNSTRVRDEGEPGIEGIEIRLDPRELADDFLEQLYSFFFPEDFERSISTDEEGKVKWIGLPAGGYRVSENAEDWISTTKKRQSVQLNPGETKEVSFGNRRPAFVVYKSDNDSGDLLPGWEICLYEAIGGDAGYEKGNLIVPCQKTRGGDVEDDFYGAAIFSSEDLEPDHYYIIDEEERAGWRLENNVDGNYEDVIDEDLGQILVRFDESFFEDGEDVYLYLYNSFTGITGYKWNDLNGDGIRDWNDANDNGDKDEDEEYTEPGLPGWTILAISDENSEETEAVTDAEGAYSFLDLDDGDYAVCEENQPGWTQTVPDPEDNDGCYEVEINGDHQANINFGNIQNAYIIVRKVAYPESEQAFDFNFDNNEEFEEFSLSGGEEETFDVVPGTYTISETVPDGWNLAHISCEYDANSVGESAPPSGETITVDAGDTVTCTFTNIDEELTIITGHKWEDLNGDGEKDEGEPGRKGWNMALGLAGEPRPGGEGEPEIIPIEIVALSLTGADGWYFLPVTQPSEYEVFEEKRDGWHTTNPPAVDSFFDITYRIDSHPQLVEGSFFDVFVENLDGQEITTDVHDNPLDFGNFEDMTITGRKWNDLDGNGKWDEGEPALAGWNMALGLVGEPIPDHGGPETIPVEIVALSLTGADGTYQFRIHSPGRYMVFEESRDGWQATNPAPHVGDPDFDLLRIGDLDFDLLHSSFFDIFVERLRSGGNISEVIDENEQDQPLEFGNHRLLLVLSEETATEVGETSTVITWMTDFSGTSRVIYDTVSHLILGEGENYGYANSTATFDESPKVTGHSVPISGLTAGTTYFYRVISSASPETVGDEETITTAALPPAPSGGGGGGGGWTPPSPTEPEGGFKFFITPDITTTDVITLNFDGGPDADKIAIADNPNFSPATYINYSTSTMWTLSGAFGEKTLYVKFFNKYTRYSRVISDTVMYTYPTIEEIQKQDEQTAIAISAPTPTPTTPTAPAAESSEEGIVLGEEAPVVQEPTAAPQPIERYLLAAIGSVITLGTSSVIVGLLVIVIVLALVGYAIYAMLQRARRKDLGKPR